MPGAITKCVSQELIIVAIAALPFASYVLGVWVASEAERRAFSRFVDQFDEVTRDHRARTPRVRMTLYQKLVDRAVRRRDHPPEPVSEPEKLRRRHVFLHLRSPVEDTQRMAADEQLTRRMQR